MLRLYPDLRIGENPRFILASNPSELMHIPDQIRKCVVYIGYETTQGEVALRGTAFLVARPLEGAIKEKGGVIPVGTIATTGISYLVTAAHIIQKISEKEDFDGKILLRFNQRNGDAMSVATKAEDWHFHPDEKEIDVAVLPFVNELAAVADIISLPISMFATEQLIKDKDIGIGDEVFLTGLFYNHHGKRRNTPIVRVGNIAAMPEEKVHSRIGFIDAYLVECRSIGGLSGSPVFVHLGWDSKTEEESILLMTNKRPHQHYFLGLMHGHWKVDIPTTQSSEGNTEDSVTVDSLINEAVNMGIAIVVPAEKILEVIDQPMIKEKEDAKMKSLRDKYLPTLDSVDEEVIITPNEFEDTLKKASRKFSSPDEEKKETSE